MSVPFATWTGVGVLGNNRAKLAELMIMDPLGSTKEHNFKKEMLEVDDLNVPGVKYSRCKC